MQLRQQLQSIKKGSSSVGDFVLEIKNLADALEAASDTISNRDLILTMMNGVGHEYDSVVTLVTSQQKTVPVKDAQFLLLMHEQRIEQLNSVSNLIVGGASANLATNTSSDKRDQKGNFNNRGGQRGRGKGNRFGGRRLL
ncbi:hypothetical protein Ddye_025195 [Dipteronia dyeriana]|uniref:Uncharacterized protein n=1 Tax=Dipteronia dyeriana TaxID=168575 RepID=A0AAD9TWE1_9ROSI|nr:hypothetical protein Ddye_025195 [Dipteronia dyeriana]